MPQRSGRSSHKRRNRRLLPRRNQLLEKLRDLVPVTDIETTTTTTITIATTTTDATMTIVAITTIAGGRTTEEATTIAGMTTIAEGTIIVAETAIVAMTITDVTTNTTEKTTIGGMTIATDDNRGIIKGITDRKTYAKTDAAHPTITEGDLAPQEMTHLGHNNSKNVNWYR